MAAELITQLRGGAAARERAYVELLRFEASSPVLDRSAVEIAVACASPLCQVLCRPVAEVGAVEWRRACQVLTSIGTLEPARIGAECQCKPTQCSLWTVLGTADCALGAVLAKQPAALTLEDALTVAGVQAALVVQWTDTLGGDANCLAGGQTAGEWATVFAPASFMINTSTPTDDRNLVLVPLLLELLQAQDQLPEFVLREFPAACLAAPPPASCPLILAAEALISVNWVGLGWVVAVAAGVIFSIAQGTEGRPAVAAKLLKEEHDVIAVLMTFMRQASPAEWVAPKDFARRPHGVGLWALKSLNLSAQDGGIDLR